MRVLDFVRVLDLGGAFPDLPALDVLNEIVTTLLEKLEKTCLAA